MTRSRQSGRRAASAPASPRYLARPPGAASSAAPEVVDLAAQAGLVLDEWQVHDLELLLAERPDGRWVTRTGVQIVPRQNGKSAVIEALILGSLFLFEDERLVTYSAHEFKTASEIFLRVRSLIENTPALDRRVKNVYTGNGKEAIELRDGTRLKIIARSKGSGRGPSPDRVIFDEAMQLTTSAIEAQVPSMSARPNAQASFHGSAPLDDPCSNVLRGLARRLRAGSSSIAGVEYSADPDHDRDDPDTWAEANPAYPYRLTDDAILAERAIMTDEGFDRERLGIYDDEDVASAISPVEWAADLDEQSTLNGRGVFAVEVAVDRSWSAIGVAGKSSRGGVHLEVIEYRQGTEWVVDRCVELSTKWGGSVGIVKGTPAAALVKALKARRLEVAEVTAEEFARMCGEMLDAIGGRGVRHIGQAELDVAVRNTVTKDVADGAVAWSRKRSTVDISPFSAVTVAAGLHGHGEPVDILSQIF